MKLRGIVPRSLRFLKKAFIICFILQLIYIIALKWINPPITITQLSSWIQGYGLKRDYVSWENISVNAKLAVMASEDQLFYHHSGFDWKSIKKAIDYNEEQEDKKRGGSTISQQTAKNVFLWQGRSWIRKGLEAYFTFMIEMIWGKKRILEVYLNVIETGKGLFGVEAAAQQYFNKQASALTPKEAALIAACLPSPKRYKVAPPTAYMQKRSGQILRQMNFIKGVKEIQELVK